MVEAKKVELGVTGLLGFQDNLKLSPLLRYEVGCPLDDVVGLNGCRLQKKGKRKLRKEHTCSE